MTIDVLDGVRGNSVIDYALCSHTIAHMVRSFEQNHLIFPYVLALHVLLHNGHLLQT